MRLNSLVSGHFSSPMFLVILLSTHTPLDLSDSTGGQPNVFVISNSVECYCPILFCVESHETQISFHCMQRSFIKSVELHGSYVIGNLLLDLEFFRKLAWG